MDYQNDEFVYYFVGYTDNTMHTYGEKGSEAAAYLAQVDAFIKKTVEKAKKVRENVTVLAFSDHGHIDLQQPYIDINDYFKARGSNVNKYIHLIESNYARFWFNNEQEACLVGTVIEDMVKNGIGFVIDQDYKDRYHLNVSPKEHGELIFYLKAPLEFTKTIWGFGHSVKSGHGFEPTIPKHYGFFCSDKPLNESREFAYLTDILPTVLRTLGISTDEWVFRGENIVG